jgi:hypothetical protein
MSLGPPETLAEFYDRVEAAVSAVERDEFAAFRREAEERHARGEDIFGDAYLQRNNPREGKEEGADGGNYSCYDHLKYRAETGDREDPALALLFTAALHFFLAHKALGEVPAKRHGSP